MSIQSVVVLKTFDWLIADFFTIWTMSHFNFLFFFEKVNVFILNVTRKKLKNLIFKNVFLWVFFFFFFCSNHFWKIWKAELLACNMVQRCTFGQFTGHLWSVWRTTMPWLKRQTHYFPHILSPMTPLDLFFSSPPRTISGKCRNFLFPFLRVQPAGVTVALLIQLKSWGWLTSRVSHFQIRSH